MWNAMLCNAFLLEDFHEFFERRNRSFQIDDGHHIVVDLVAQEAVRAAAWRQLIHLRERGVPFLTLSPAHVGWLAVLYLLRIGDKVLCSQSVDLLHQCLVGLETYAVEER